MRVINQRIREPIVIELTYEEAAVVANVTGAFARSTLAKHLGCDIESHKAISSQKVTDELYDLITDFYDNEDNE